MTKSQDEEVKISQLIDGLRGYRCLPFLGAGISKPSGTPTWSELINQLSRRLRLPKGHTRLSILQIPGYYEQRFKRKSLIDRIREHLNDEALLPNDYHDTLVTLPFRTYLTTNWDTLIEKSLKKSHITPNPIRDDTDVPTFNEYSSINVVKMHGCITHDDIVVTEYDYWNYPSKWPLLSNLVRTLLASRSVFFLGFSFSDPNVGFIFHDVTSQVRGSGAPSFVVFVDEDETWVRYCQERLGLSVINLSTRPNESKEKALLRLLHHLKAEAQIRAHDKADRAELLLRETRRATVEVPSGLLLRVRASLGPFGSPNPYGRPKCI